MITQYIIAEHHNVDEFRKEVNHLLAVGWKLQGGVAMTTRREVERDASTTDYIVYAQAMVK